MNTTLMRSKGMSRASIATALALYLAEYALYSNSSSTVLLGSSIANDFHVSFTVASYVGVTFLSGFCFALLPAGVISRRYKPIYVFLWSSIILVILGAIVGLSPNLVSLLVLRFLQGVVSAMLAPQIFGTIKSRFQAPESVRVIGMWALVVSLAALCSPIITSVLNDVWGWRSFPVETTVVGVVSFLLILWVIKKDKLDAITVDKIEDKMVSNKTVLVSFLIGVIPLSMFLFANLGIPKSSKLLAMCLVIAIVCAFIIAIWWWLSRHSDKMGRAIETMLFKNFIVLLFISVGANLYTLWIIYFLQQVRLVSSYQSALYLIPMAIMAGLIPVLPLGRPGSNKKNVTLIFLGCISFILAGISLILPLNELAVLLMSSTLMGCGMGCSWSSFAAVVVRNSPRVQIDSSGYNYLRALGGAIGIVISTSLLPILNGQQSGLFTRFAFALMIIGVLAGVIALSGISHASRIH